jgi:hypothetical protein
MKWFAYKCPRCGPFDLDGIAEESVQCRCGRTAKRSYQIQVLKSSLKPYGHWDPVVGAYVENEGQFKSLLAQGVEEQSIKNNMDYKVATVDARDTEGLAELHGQTVEERMDTRLDAERALAGMGGPKAIDREFEKAKADQT